MVYVMSNSSYLEHHGIKGQKWGIRRFQNPDGTRTALGRKREAADRKRNLKTAGAAAAGLTAAIGAGIGINKASKNVNKDKLFDKSLIKGGKDKPSMSPAEKIAKDVGNVGTEAGKILKTAQKVGNSGDNREVKTLSDQELRKRIERLNLEKQYESLVAEDYERGHVTANDILGTVGSVVAIGGSIASMLAVANMVKN